MVENDEVYGRFIMFPRHYEKNVIGDKFISLRPVDQGGISGFILSRFSKDDNIEEYKNALEEKTKQTISSMGTAIVKVLRACSLERVLSVDVVLTQESFPYHAEIRLFSEKEQSLIIKNSRSSEFIYVCEKIKEVLLKNKVVL